MSANKANGSGQEPEQTAGEQATSITTDTATGPIVNGSGQATAESTGKRKGKAQGNKAAESDISLILKITSSAELFHSPGNDAYINMNFDDHRENWPVRANEVREKLLFEFLWKHKRVPSASTMEQAISVLEVKAKNNGNEESVFTRLGYDADSIVVDLCNDKWEAVRITADGCEIVKNPQTRLIRHKGMLPLPYPKQGGKIASLGKYLNIENASDLVLSIGWLLGALKPNGPYPILVLLGGPGSAKSTTTQLLRSLIDPNEAPLRALPKDERDLRVTANNSHIVALDNLSGLSRGMADALCRIATGGGFSTRKLYTDDGEIMFRGARPMILNGIDRLTERSDLADRAIVIELPSIDEGMRKTERELNAEFEAARPGIFGALLTVVSHALRNLPQVHLEKKSRMADFEEWCEAAAPALGLKPGVFQALYSRNRKETASQLVESDVVAEAIRSYLDHNVAQGEVLELTSQTWMNVLNTGSDCPDWPTTPAKFSAHLRRLEASLLSIGIRVTFRKSNGTRLVAISRVGRVGTGSQGNSPIDPAKPEPKDQNSLVDPTISDTQGETQGRQGRSNSYPLLEKQEKEKEIEKEEKRVDE